MTPRNNPDRKVGNAEASFLKKLEKRYPELKKPYFAKYLPNKGDYDNLKKGEMIFAFGAEGDTPGTLCVYTGEQFGICGAKLFLCSRDIKVGDNITLDGIEFVKYENGEVDSIWRKHIEQGFKAIGEISPDAIWVKEGEEFDEDEVGWIEHHYEGPATRVPLSEGPIYDQEFWKLIVIKGPCGHFH